MTSIGKFKTSPKIIWYEADMSCAGATVVSTVCNRYKNILTARRLTQCQKFTSFVMTISKS